MTILEETPSTVYFVLPPFPSETRSVLSDEGLEAVAGGYTGDCSDSGVSCGCD